MLRNGATHAPGLCGKVRTLSATICCAKALLCSAHAPCPACETRTILTSALDMVEAGPASTDERAEAMLLMRAQLLCWQVVNDLTVFA